MDLIRQRRGRNLRRQQMIEILIYTSILGAGFVLGIIASTLVKPDRLIGFYHFNVWEQTKSNKIHITPRAGGKLGIKSANENGVLIVLE